MTPQTPPEREGSIPNGRTTGNERAVSDLVGFIMVFALVVSVVAIVSLAGMSSLESARDAEQSNNAVRAMEVFSDNVADIHERGAPSRATEISLNDGAQMYLERPITVTVNGSGGGGFKEHFGIRPVVYRGPDGARLVYVNGALFREQREGGRVIESWSATVGREATLLPILSTSSATGEGQSLQSSTVLVRGTATRRDVRVADDSSTYEDVWVNVTTERTDLWSRMLDERAAVSCSTTHPGAVNCSLDHDPERLFVTETRIPIELAE